MYSSEVSALRLTVLLMGTVLKVGDNSQYLTMVVRILEIDTSSNVYYPTTFAF